MGAKLSSPSEVLDQVWMPDNQAPHCCNCSVAFSFTVRRHHCRCDGCCYCVKCWGNQVNLEALYGFPGPVPVCGVCAEMMLPQGPMSCLRKGVTVAFTHEPRSNVTGESQIPPLANANIKTRKFTTNNLRLHKWRPFTRRTVITLSKTKSSREVLRSRSGLGTTPRARSGSVGPRDSTTSSVGGGGAGDWTIELDAIESIQLMNVSEKDGGDYILISTDFEEHRIQAIKMRFEEMSTLNNPAAIAAVETASQAVSESTSLSPDGGDRDNGSERRSNMSSGTRLRTVMLDREGTAELCRALQRAHTTCRRRASSMPPEVRAFIDLDIPTDEAGPNSGAVTPRAGSMGSPGRPPLGPM